MKVLILRFSSIGDIVLTSPVVRCLRETYPDATIHYCTKLKYRELVCHNPNIDGCHYLETTLANLLTRLWRENYDLVIDLHNNLRSNLIKHFLGKRRVTVDKISVRKWLYVRFKLMVMPDTHIVDRYMNTVRGLGVVNDNRGLNHFLGADEQVPLSSLPPSFRRSYAAYAIGGEHRTKRLPVARMIDLCRTIGQPVVLVGGPGDRAAGEAVRLALGDAHIYNACGLFSINQSASVVRQAQVVYSHDTGLMHIAAAFKKNIVSIWGSTTPQLGMYPYQTAYRVIENKKVACRPCSKIGRNQCPGGHFDCMNTLSF